VRGTHFLKSAEGRTSQNLERKERVSVTHSLETASGWTSQDMERMQTSEEHLLSGDRIGMD
jgi:hypothetical protein